MSKHIVGADRVRLPVFRNDLFDGLSVKITVQRRHPLAVRLRSKIFGRLDTHTPHSGFFITGNKQAVITADIHSQRFLLLGKATPDILGIRCKMRSESLRGGTHIKVFIEHQMRWHRMRQLYQMTFTAFDHRERAMEFGLGRIGCAGKIVC